jgi:hypothetical protein
MRLYLLDLSEGSSARILAIAFSAPEAGLEAVLEEAPPILDSYSRWMTMDGGGHGWNRNHSARGRESGGGGLLDS